MRTPWSPSRMLTAPGSEAGHLELRIAQYEALSCAIARATHPPSMTFYREEAILLPFVPPLTEHFLSDCFSPRRAKRRPAPTFHTDEGAVRVWEFGVSYYLQPLRPVAPQKTRRSHPSEHRSEHPSSDRWRGKVGGLGVGKNPSPQ
jgi:hypothetical protein